MLRRTVIYAVAALLFLLGMRLGTALQARDARQGLAPGTMQILVEPSAKPSRLAPTLRRPAGRVVPLREPAQRRPLPAGSGPVPSA
jgi:hypothetical protein